MGQTTVTIDKETNEFIAERVFDASRAQVWGAFTDAEKLAKWWGPRGWETTVKTFDFKPGGEWLYGMKCVDENQGEYFGQESWGKAVYDEIDEPNKITYRDYFTDAEGMVNDSMPTSHTSLEFFEQDGKTRVITRTAYDKPEELQAVTDMGMEQGFKETWDRLAEFVESK